HAGYVWGGVTRYTSPCVDVTHTPPRAAANAPTPWPPSSDEPISTDPATVFVAGSTANSIGPAPTHTVSSPAASAYTGSPCGKRTVACREPVRWSRRN